MYSFANAGLSSIICAMLNLRGNFSVHKVHTITRSLSSLTKMAICLTNYPSIRGGRGKGVFFPLVISLFFSELNSSSFIMKFNLHFILHARKSSIYRDPKLLASESNSLSFSSLSVLQQYKNVAKYNPCPTEHITHAVHYLPPENFSLENTTFVLQSPSHTPNIYLLPDKGYSCKYNSYSTTHITRAVHLFVGQELQYSRVNIVVIYNMLTSFCFTASFLSMLGRII